MQAARIAIGDCDALHEADDHSWFAALAEGPHPALDAIAAESGEPALLVSHGNLMTLLLNSIDASFGFDAWKAMTNPDVFLLEPRTDGYSIERIWDAG